MLSFNQFITEQKVKALMRGKTKKGEPVMLAKLPNGNYHVFIQKTNYERGRDVKNWYRIPPRRNMPDKDEQEFYKTGEPDKDAAMKLFKRRATGGIE